MFKLVFDHPAANGKIPVVVHENKPVAVRESLYKVLTTAHAIVQHGGRDKTSQEVRKNYSWVPKELIARFVRTCPTCVVKRNPGGRNSGRPMRRTEQKQRREEMRRQQIQEAEHRDRHHHSPPAPIQQEQLPQHPLHLALGGHEMHSMYPMQAPTPPSSTSSPMLAYSAPEAMMALSAPAHDALLARHYPVYMQQHQHQQAGMVTFQPEYAFDPRGLYASGPGGAIN
ncbi:MAG: hypothetical protein M1829_004067 [Trizodia sp. TS-e1964]|nr:MAG: hypothetical protein M1829_004067 [Trizodia sp. TS-e1964]